MNALLSLNTSVCISCIQGHSPLYKHSIIIIIRKLILIDYYHLNPQSPIQIYQCPNDALYCKKIQSMIMHCIYPSFNLSLVLFLSFTLTFMTLKLLKSIGQYFIECPSVSYCVMVRCVMHLRQKFYRRDPVFS